MTVTEGGANPAERGSTTAVDSAQRGQVGSRVGGAHLGVVNVCAVDNNTNRAATEADTSKQAVVGSRSQLQGLQPARLNPTQAYVRVVERYKAEQSAFRGVKYGNWLEVEAARLEAKTDQLMAHVKYQHEAYRKGLEREHLLISALNEALAASGKPLKTMTVNGDGRWVLVDSKKPHNGGTNGKS